MNKTRTLFNRTLVLRNQSLKHLFLLRHQFQRNFCISNYKSLPLKKPKYWNIAPQAMETEDWLTIGQYKVCPWALSGVESCIVVVGIDFSVAFDMGYAYPAAVKCRHVFISHGHMDHVAGIMNHASKRGLYNMPPATYYVPPHLVQPLTDAATAFSTMNEQPINLHLQSVTVGETIHLPGGIQVKPFPTIHRVRSQGYIVYRVKKHLKPEYQGQTSKAVSSLVKEGSDIFDVETTAEVAYTGDTISDVFCNPHNPDILKVKLLITESTYVDDENEGRNTVEKARERGHMHLNEIIEKEALFADVKNILLVHFSDKYSSKYICEQISRKVPQTMKEKLHLGLVLKEKFRYC